jgi:DNA helicase-2/ATP-dependent DNA helicase PcrA
MTVETFTREEFEAALPTRNGSDEPLWQYAGLVEGEHTYHIPVEGTNKRIVIRSSVGRDGVSAESGADSIRLWVEYYWAKIDDWRALAKLDRWTTRVSGWERRMTEKLRELWALAMEDSRKSSTSMPTGDAVEDGTATGADNKPPKKSNNETRDGKGEGLSVPLGGEEGPQSSTSTSTSEGMSTTPTATPTSDLVDPPPSSPSDSPLSFGEEMVTIPEEEDEEELAPKVEKPRPTPNEDQARAITMPVDAAVRVLAGPGSGKTFCTEERIAYLLENGARPKDILAVTFSKAMATSALERILRRNPELKDTEAEDQICTIHAICYRMLRDDGDRRRVPKEWQIKKAINEIIEVLWPVVDERPGWKEVYHWINMAKYNGLPTSEDFEFYRKCLGFDNGRNLHEARRLFDQRMRGQKLLTFSDMIFDVEMKLKREVPFRTKWQRRFQWVLIDEAQDTSAQAMRILATLAEPQNQVFIVGDVDQLLYRFAGATPEANLYDGFDSRYPDGHTVKLKINYRSTREIVRCQLRLIEWNYEESGGPYEQRFLKELSPREGAPEGEPVSFEEYEDAQEEAAALVGALREQLANGREPGHFFVGARTRAQLGYLEGPLVRAKVPFINIAGGSFWGSKHVADVVAYLRLATDDTDSAAFKRVYNIASNWNVHPWGEREGEYCHHRYLGKAFMEACGGSYQHLTSATRSSFQPGIQDLVELVGSFRQELAASGLPGRVLRVIIEDCYRKYLAAEEGVLVSDEAENGKLEDLETVIEVASQFETAQEFLEYVDEAVRAAEAAKDKSWDDYVVLSTVHRLKGLEREVVYGVGVSESQAVSFEEGGVGDKVGGLLPHTFSLTEPPQNGVLPTGGKGRVEDERCIAFVLVSRAKEEVHLSSVRMYRRYGMGPSRFIEEMELIESRVESRVESREAG